MSEADAMRCGTTRNGLCSRLVIVAVIGEVGLFNVRVGV